MSKKLGHRTEIQIFSVLDEEWVKIAQASTTGISRSADSVDVTTFDSPLRYREFIKGLLDGGELTISVVFDPEFIGDFGDEWGQVALDDMFENCSVESFRIKLPDEDNVIYIYFDAILTGDGLTVPLDDAITKEYTLKITGPIEEMVTPIV